MKFAAFLFSFMFAVTAVGKPLPDGDPKLAKELVTQKNALLLDVRSDSEYSRGSLAGAKHVPISDLKSKLGEIEKWQGGNKTQPIVVFCAAGGRASKAKKILMKAGYTQVTNLGGMKDWPK